MQDNPMYDAYLGDFIDRVADVNDKDAVRQVALDISNQSLYINPLYLYIAAGCVFLAVSFIGYIYFGQTGNNTIIPEIINYLKINQNNIKLMRDLFNSMQQAHGVSVQALEAQSDVNTNMLDAASHILTATEQLNSITRIHTKLLWELLQNATQANTILQNIVLYLCG